jgi:uncharacterized radical SAM protein YgiQ
MKSPNQPILYKSNWLPITKQEMDERGWDQPDVILVSGDAYVDHPGFGTAVIGRVLENIDLKVVILPQPNWRDDLRDFKKFGQPRLFFGISAGCMDSMVNHYTAARRLRSDDAYTPGGTAGFRPDYASIVYSLILKKLYPDTPVILGGIEASLRRLTHYDYWSDKLKPSILVESNADLLVYGMGEKSIISIAERLRDGETMETLTDIPQTAFFKKEKPEFTEEAHLLHSHEECLKNKRKQAENFRVFEEESNRWISGKLIQQTGSGWVVINQSHQPSTPEELDAVYALPFTRLPHPKYRNRGSIPAYEMIRHSITLHRGCFGGCSFCTISAHQGKFVSSRSEASVLSEVQKVTEMPDFKGYISDLGGPSANMYKMQGTKIDVCKKCKRPSCIFPNICPNLNTSHKALINLYRDAANIKGIKKIFVGSGVRYDLLFDKNNKLNHQNYGHEYARQLITSHVSGRLKVAPEHTNNAVLQHMRKPSFQLFRVFKKIFEEENQKAGLRQQLIPYFISSHPGCKAEFMAELAADTKDLGYKLEQVQDFTPTPMTLSTEIYYTGIDPYTLQPVFTARTPEEKKAQNRYFFWYKSENIPWIKSNLAKVKRMDIVNRLYSRK